MILTIKTHKKLHKAIAVKNMRHGIGMAAIARAARKNKKRKQATQFN